MLGGDWDLSERECRIGIGENWIFFGFGDGVGYGIEFDFGACE